MLQRVSATRVVAISASAANCREKVLRQDFAEPLWFAGLCRHLWPGNAPKELEFALARNGVERSDRTCRAWASGDSPPPFYVLAILWMDAEIGKRVEQYIKDGCTAPWWVADEEAMRAGYAALSQIKR